MYDFIGDIHGHADALKALLDKLGYTIKQNVYRHPERKAVFVGDFIDRGPQSREALNIARSMYESDQALAVLGNHEYNAICLYHQYETGEYFRPRSFKNIRQVSSTLLNFREHPDEWFSHIEWMKKIPLFLELPEGIRVVHAFWNDRSIKYLREAYGSGTMTEEFIKQSRKVNSEEYWAIGNCLIGQELELPEGMFFYDSDGRKRNDMRVKWWEDPKGKTFEEIGLSGQFPAIPIGNELEGQIVTYAKTAPILFFGHYWMKGQPCIQESNICCLDFSIAKGGHLTAYSWNGEKELQNENLVWV